MTDFPDADPSEIDIPPWFNGVFTFMTGEEAPYSFLKHTSVSLSAQLRSGVPYTPTSTIGGFGVTQQGERYSGTGPSYKQVNLRAQKGVRFGGVVYSFFMLVNNLFDTKNCLQPYPTTGDCNAGARDQSRRRQGNTTGEATSSTYFDRPHLFGTRREINFGVRLDF